MEEKKYSEFTEAERNAFIDACCEYDDELKRNGHFVAGEAMDSTQGAKTLRLKNGKISATDGPFAETKEQLGGIMLLEAENMDHAVALMSKHPSIRFGGTWEIRKSDDLSGMIKESEERRSVKKISL
jgi:hypothetical protein